jgi:hypothetical protein
MRAIHAILLFSAWAFLKPGDSVPGDLKGASANAATIATGPSGALDCVDFGPGVCDVVTAVVPLNASANNITGAWTFQQLRVSLYTVATLPPCNAGLEGQMEGVSDATAAIYNGVARGGGTIHLPVYCNGGAWVMH